MYRDIKISKIELKNASGTVCSLECYYKLGKDDKPQRIGSTGNFPLGQIKTLDLRSLKDLPEGAWVTAYSNVSWGADSEGDDWFIYSKDADLTAFFSISGTAFKTYTSFVSEDLYHEEPVSKLKLNNRAGATCCLFCYYKINKDDTPKLLASICTEQFPIGQSATLNIDYNENIPDGAWVTAYVDVMLGTPLYSHVWFPYKRKEKKCAEYTTKGVINLMEVEFDKVEDVK